MNGFICSATAIPTVSVFILFSLNSHFQNQQSFSSHSNVMLPTTYMSKSTCQITYQHGETAVKAKQAHHEPAHQLLHLNLKSSLVHVCNTSVQFTQSCPTLCNPMNSSMPGLPVHRQLPEFTQPMSIEPVMPSSHLILCHPLLLLPPIPPSIRVFSNESTLHMRCPKYWSFSFSISPSNEHPGLISFRMD